MQNDATGCVIFKSNKIECFGKFLEFVLLFNPCFSKYGINNCFYVFVTLQVRRSVLRLMGSTQGLLVKSRGQF